MQRAAYEPRGEALNKYGGNQSDTLGLTLVDKKCATNSEPLSWMPSGGLFDRYEHLGEVIE